MSTHHPMFGRQLLQATDNGELDIDKLSLLVGQAYEEKDRELRRSDHANRVMTAEIEETNEALQISLKTMELQNIRFSAALNNMRQGLCLFDKSGLLVVRNRAFDELYQLPENFDPVGLSLRDILLHSGVFAKIAAREKQSAIDEHADLPIDELSSIEQIWHDERTVSIVRNCVEDGGYLDTITDVTEQRQAVAKIAYMANYDALTDLPNRTLFAQRLSEAMARANRGEVGAVMSLDLDRFKAINDTMGHPAGDALLVEVAKRLSCLVRSTDTVARLGGDEFAIILSSLKRRKDAEKLAERIIESISKPYLIEGRNVSIGVSIGYEFVDRNLKSKDELMRNIDIALYKSKENGRGCFSCFIPDMHQALNEQELLKSDLKAALKNHEFLLHYQPMYNVQTRELGGFEALVRWQSPSRGLVEPADFIPCCEENDLINELGEWVLRRACKDAAFWPDHLKIAVNISPVQFKSNTLMDATRVALAESGLRPGRLELEITENVLMLDIDETTAALKELRGLGVSLSLDDFGTGYSSFSYVRQFVFDTIKVDRTFIRDLESNRESLAIVRAIVGLSKSLGIVTIAEGVETEAQHAILQQEGCDIFQGFLLSRPVPFRQTFEVMPATPGMARVPVDEHFSARPEKIFQSA